MARLMSMAFFLTTMCCATAQDNRVDLTDGWLFRPDPKNVGTEEKWFAVDADEHGWLPAKAGVRWEEQGFPDLDGVAWYRRHSAIPEAWRNLAGPVHFVAGGINDACEVYLNGQRLNTFGNEQDLSFAQRPVVVDLTPRLNREGDNVLAIRVLDWGGSGGLWHVPCFITTDTADLPQVPLFQGHVDYAAEKFHLGVDATNLGRERPDAVFAITLGNSACGPMRLEVPLPRGQTAASLTVSIPGAASGQPYDVEARLEDASGNVLGKPSNVITSRIAEMPSWPGEYGQLKVLNSFVTELLSRHDLKPTYKKSEPQRITFQNPRDGWVYIELSFGGVVNGFGEDRLYVDNQPEPVVLRPTANNVREAMVHLAKGEHTIRFDFGDSVVVRAVPELAYCYYLSNPHIAPYGPYDKVWMERHILPDANTLVTAGAPPPEDLAEWTRQGRRWIANDSLPGLSSEQAPAAQDVYAQWANTAGAAGAAYSGLIVDEFITASPAHYAAWGQAVSSLYDDPRFAGKTFYAFCGDLYEDAHSLAFAKSLMARGGLFALERYITEEPTETVARGWLQQEFPESVKAWEAALPGVTQRLVYVLGVMCGPPEGLDSIPSVDFNVLMEMQFNLMANDPAFFGLYGVMTYSASYADEEALRWTYRLIRHYCIEGKRGRLSYDPYILPHLYNGDFEGLDGWAVEGDVTTATMEGLSHMEGRYPDTKQGNTYAVMKRAGDKPNSVRQTIRNLEPGKPYSLKLLAFHPDHLDAQVEVPFDIDLTGGDVDPSRSFRYMYPINYAHTFGPYTREHPAYFTYYRLVFRPTAKEVELVIADAGHTLVLSDGGSAKGEHPRTGVNFVQVQRYFAP